MISRIVAATKALPPASEKSRQLSLTSFRRCLAAAVCIIRRKSESSSPPAQPAYVIQDATSPTMWFCSRGLCAMMTEGTPMCATCIMVWPAEPMKRSASATTPTKSGPTGRSVNRLPAGVIVSTRLGIPFEKTWMSMPANAASTNGKTRWRSREGSVPPKKRLYR